MWRSDSTVLNFDGCGVADRRQRWREDITEIGGQQASHNVRVGELPVHRAVEAGPAIEFDRQRRLAYRSQQRLKLLQVAGGDGDLQLRFARSQFSGCVRLASAVSPGSTATPQAIRNARRSGHAARRSRATGRSRSAPERWHPAPTLRWRARSTPSTPGLPSHSPRRWRSTCPAEAPCSTACAPLPSGTPHSP